MSTATPRTPHSDRIESPIRRLRGLIRTYVSLEGVATIALFLTLWFWIGLLFDYGIFRAFRWDWVQEMPWWSRASVLGCVLAALFALVLTRIFLRIFRDFSHESLALVLERRFPDKLGDRLITAVQLADVEKAAKYGFSADMIRKTIDDANERMEGVPVAQVFDWRRLVRQGLLVGCATLGISAVVLGGAVAYQKITGRGSIGEFAAQSKDVAIIWTERNVLLRNTPWPREVYLEMPDFQGDELRVGRDGAAPRIRVVATKWVIADESVPDGWRPMTWGEITPAMIGGPTPELPLGLLQLGSKQLMFGAPGMALSPVPMSAYIAALLKPSDAGLRLPADLPQNASELNNWRVDQVERTFLLNEDVRSYLRLNLPADQLLALEQTFEKLGAFGTDPANARYVRMLTLPGKVYLDYWGLKTDNEAELDRVKEGDSEYVGTLSDLKESVKVRATAGDYATPVRRVTLVPPPQLEIFERDEFRPAYIYHRPPVDTKLPGLRGLQQELLHLGISRTGERSRFEIPIGTDLVIRGSADKPLSKVMLIPKPGKFPGNEVEPAPIELKLFEAADPTDPEQKRQRQFFEFAFNGEYRILRTTDFDIEFTDTDNVTTKRAVQIQPIEDKSPEVDVVIEVIRKVGNTYMCSPRAFVPFAKESRIRDDHGLNRVDYRFTYRQVESVGVVTTRASITAGIMLMLPGQPNLGSLVYGPLFVEQYRPLIQPTVQTEFSRIESLDGFTELMKERAPDDVVARVLAERLKQPLPNDPKVMREFDFKLAEAFDLQKLLPDVDVKDENKFQPRYTINLTITATDSNVEQALRPVAGRVGAMLVMGGPAGLEAPEGRTAENKETFTLTVVSEADLLAEISKEEEGLINKLEEVVTRLKDSQSKLGNIVDRLPTQKPEEMLADSTMANNINETAAKCRDMSQDLLKDYQRILREYQVNRLNKRLIEKLEAQIVLPLEQVVRVDFPALEEPLTTFNNAFTEQRKPDQQVAEQARDRLKIIVDKLSRIRDGVGEIVSIKKVIDLIQQVIKTQETEVKAQLLKIRDAAIQDELKVKILPAAPVMVTNLQKTKVKLSLRFGLESDDQITVKLEAPANSELKLPAELKVEAPIGEDVATVEFEIQAGTKKGDFPVRLVPSDGGRAGSITITVK